MREPPDYRIGPHDVAVRRVAGRWTVAVDGRLLAGFFGTEAQASGAALLAVSGRERDLEELATGDTLAFQPVGQWRIDTEP
jgi:hypothetical protein